jgi:N-acetyl-gamma-glutamyl-phosphate reductase
MTLTIRVAVAGASGYMGAELLRLLLTHPHVQLTRVTSERLAGQPVSSLFPSLRRCTPLSFTALDPEEISRDADLVLLALPHTESQQHVPVFRRRGLRVIDLSADYRIKDAVTFARWYTTPHGDPDGLAEAVYGLPELHRKAITSAPLVANPGCYPVGAILAMAPLFKAGIARTEGVVVDGKSGVTGAGAQGRQVDPMYLYTEANENVRAYGVATHRHTPEIEQELSAVSGQAIMVSFTPHLIPINRGLFTTASVPLVRPTDTASARALYEEFYAGEPFVRVLPENQLPTTRAVLGSNYCDVSVVVDQRVGRAICLTAIDNLGKGGSQQAIQNMNLMLGWDERTGLDSPPVYP